MTGRPPIRRPGIVHTNTDAYQTIRMNSSRTASHSHHDEYGVGPMTNWTSSSDTGERSSHRRQACPDACTAGESRMRDAVGRQELRKTLPPFEFGPAIRIDDVRPEL